MFEYLIIYISISSFFGACADAHLAGWGIAVSPWPTVKAPQAQVDTSQHFH